MIRTGSLALALVASASLALAQEGGPVFPQFERQEPVELELDLTPPAGKRLEVPKPQDVRKPLHMPTLPKPPSVLSPEREVAERLAELSNSQLLRGGAAVGGADPSLFQGPAPTSSFGVEAVLGGPQGKTTVRIFEFPDGPTARAFGTSPRGTGTTAVELRGGWVAEVSGPGVAKDPRWTLGMLQRAWDALGRDDLPPIDTRMIDLRGSLILDSTVEDPEFLALFESARRFEDDSRTRFEVVDGVRRARYAHGDEIPADYVFGYGDAVRLTPPPAAGPATGLEDALQGATAPRDAAATEDGQPQ